MNEKKSFRLPERNPKTFAIHRREVFWQITFPVLLALLILLALGVSVVIASARGNPEIRRWADISLVWVVAPVLVFSLLFLILNAAFVFLLSRLIKILPGFTRLVHNYVLIVQHKVRQVTDKIVQPFIKSQGILAGMRALRKR